MMAEASGPSRDDTIALLRWYADMGIDTVVDQTPHDRFSEPGQPVAERADATGHGAPDMPTRPASSIRPPAISPPPALPLPGTDEATRSARDLAAACNSLDALRSALDRFEGCSLSLTASQLVFGDGNPTARIMAVGEAPGADEDRQGVPFVGRSGHLFDRMLSAIGLDRTQVYMTDVIPWRPPGDRTPTPQEAAICLPFLTRHVELVAPDYLLCLGASSAQTLLGIKDGILRARGRWIDYPLPDRSVRAMPMLHPTYLLRQPGHKRLAWRDLLELRRALDAAPEAIPPESSEGTGRA